METTPAKPAFTEMACTGDAPPDVFSRAWNYCVDQLCNGAHEVYLADNIRESLGGDLGMKFLAERLSAHVGYYVSIAPLPEMETWNAFLPNEMEPQHHLPTQPDDKTSPPKVPKRAAGQPPRPMNCFMLYRDSMYKQLKAKHPELTVKEISAMTSAGWKNMSAADKDFWKEQARLAKETHLRLYPHYKYQPRKPGQKKKRQSRKVTQSTVEFGSFPDTTMPALGASEAATNAIAAHISNTLPNDADDFAGILASLAEQHRQERLEEDFVSFFDFTQYDTVA